MLTKGQRIRRGGLTLVSSPGPDDETRIGLVVGRTVGNAVKRNRAKRRLRQALRQMQWEQGMDYVIIADREVGEAPYAVLSDWLDRAVRGSR